MVESAIVISDNMYPLALVPTLLKRATCQTHSVQQRFGDFLFLQCLCIISGFPEYPMVTDSSSSTQPQLPFSHNIQTKRHCTLLSYPVIVTGTSWGFLVGWLQVVVSIRKIESLSYFFLFKHQPLLYLVFLHPPTENKCTQLLLFHSAPFFLYNCVQHF